MHIYIVSGGIGKHVMFSSLIERLVEKHGEKISIMSPYPAIFEFHPNVRHSVRHNEPGFYDKYMIREDTNIHHAEPYYSDYIKGKTHLTTEWAKLLDIPCKDVLPDIYVDDFAVEEANRFHNNNNKFIITQFSGGQSPINFDSSNRHINDGQLRDYPRDLAQRFVDGIKKEHQDLTILNYALPNEQSADLENTISIQAPYLFYVALLQMCSTYICIDSSLHHLAANKFNKRKGVVIWGSTGPKNLGYNKNINISNAKNGKHTIRPLTNTMGDVFNKDGSVWVNPDPTSMLVDPNKLIDEANSAIFYNNDIETKFTNAVINEKRKNSSIDLDPNTSKLISGLSDQAENLNNQANNIIDQYVKSKGLDGKFILSKDGQKLIKS